MAYAGATQPDDEKSQKTKGMDMSKRDATLLQEVEAAAGMPLTAWASSRPVSVTGSGLLLEDPDGSRMHLSSELVADPPSIVATWGASAL